jgi:hypothetical protein
MGTTDVMVSERPDLLYSKFLGFLLNTAKLRRDGDKKVGKALKYPSIKFHSSWLLFKPENGRYLPVIDCLAV